MRILQTIILLVLLTAFRTDNPVKRFRLKYFDKFKIEGVFSEEFPDWIYNVVCYYDNKLVFKADSLMEFEFKERAWPKGINLGNNKFQLLLEYNDRPRKNKILLLTFENGKEVNRKIIPSFDNAPKDYDNDGAIEFYDQIDYPEALENPNKTNYIPTLFYEDNWSGFRLDSSLTISYNSKLWGKFYGFEPNYKLILTPNRTK